MIASTKNRPDANALIACRERWPLLPVLFALLLVPAIARAADVRAIAPIALAIALALFVAIVYGQSRGYAVYAGDGWLKDGPTTVRTDRLTMLTLRYTTAGARLEMRDRDGGYVWTSSADLARDPAIWALLSAGVRKSSADGLRVDRLTAIAFALPQASGQA